jgi:hypothetical protein
VEDRVRVLRAMSGGAGFGEYEAAFRRVHGEGASAIGSRTLAEDAELVGIRPPSPEPEPEQDATARAREALAVLDRVARLSVIPCACGLAIKLPVDWGEAQVTCPRCRRVHDVAEAHPAGIGEPTPLPPADEPPQSHRREGAGWDAFNCRCGHRFELSPEFVADHVTCPQCGRDIRIEDGKSIE